MNYKISLFYNTIKYRLSKNELLVELALPLGFIHEYNNIFNNCINKENTYSLLIDKYLINLDYL